MSHYQQILNLLDEHEISYKRIHHEVTRTSEDSARVRGEDLSTGGKALVLKIHDNGKDDDFALFILSASRQLHTKKIRKEFHTKNVRFANPQELSELTNGLVPGSVPPFGRPILDLDLFVDNSVVTNEHEIIAFNCGSLTDSVVMNVQDWLKTANPTKVFQFSK
jgi:prolyl-tRNA editing enzyme YbaK/EbsC (Cys-tRNA(Pro) deacylase)